MWLTTSHQCSRELSCRHRWEIAKASPLLRSSSPRCAPTTRRALPCCTSLLPRAAFLSCVRGGAACSCGYLERCICGSTWCALCGRTKRWSGRGCRFGVGGEVLRGDEEEGLEAPGGRGVGSAGRRVLRSHALAPASGEHGPRRGAPRQHVRGARQDAAGAVRGHRQPRPRARHSHLHIPLRQATVRHRPGSPPIASAYPPLFLKSVWRDIFVVVGWEQLVFILLKMWHSCVGYFYAHNSTEVSSWQHIVCLVVCVRQPFDCIIASLVLGLRGHFLRADGSWALICHCVFF
jgi:hypothetical protein